MSKFQAPINDKTQENGTVFRPKFDANGLITAIVSDHNSNEILMLAFMNEEALALTIKTGEAHYWSRSRNELWHKGATSGNVQLVKEIRTDCDQDAIVLKVEMTGAKAACHTGRVSCFYRTVENTDDSYSLTLDANKPKFDPDEVYKK